MKITKDIKPSIFREYDVRGVYGIDLNEDVAYTFGKSYGSYIRKYNSNRVLVGHDNRLSSPILSNALIKGILDSGINVVDLGIVTTPMYYFARKKLDISTGIMITASHNPKDDNGFKMSFESFGNAYGDYIYDFRDFTLKGVYIDGVGKLETYDIRDEYIELLKNSVSFDPSKIKVVVDCGNGTGSIIIKDILDAIGITYFPLYCESDGNFPNHPSDPAVPKNMIDLSNKVLELGYDLGIGIDGDADRVGIVDEKGNIIPTDLYMLIMYRNMCKNMKTKKALFDVKCSKTLIDELEKLGLEPIMYRTGNSYCNMMMQKGDFDFGGEYSGHVFFRDKFPGFDDGIYAGLRMIEVIANTGIPVSKHLENINKYYSTEELKFKSSDEKKFLVIEKIKEYAISKDYQYKDIDGVRVEFSDGWALVRASNTGPNITVRFEANTEKRLEEIKTEFETILKQNL
ncbi:MAG: phosphomannomutase/phosphoglucomutase [Firmicutes bacterium]|nr:phosphomannomutase/phosphoglucomutase [Bacillota bacterium]